jgi:hypothetical protein
VHPGVTVAALSLLRRPQLLLELINPLMKNLPSAVVASWPAHG